MVYMGDEGRDMLVVFEILEGKNLPFIGPPTSVGQLYLGPIYYYFITPFVWIFNMNPVGPAVFVAIIGIFTIPLIYLVGKVFFEKKAGLFSAGLYTLSPLIVRFSRSSWNPNPMPFFTLLLMLSLYYWHKKKKSKFLYLGVFSYAVMLQLHYMPILLIPFLLFILFMLKKNIKDKKTLFYAFLIFFVLLTPLLVFDLKHNFVNTRGIIEIFRERSSLGFSISDLVSRTRDRIRQLFSLFLSFSERERKTNLAVLIVLALVLFDWFKQKSITKLVIYGWVIWGFLTVGLYRGNIYPHYLGFLFPIPALLLGKVLTEIYNKFNKGKIISLILFILICGQMFKAAWGELSRAPVLNVTLVKKIVRLIERESGGEQFNFALLARNNYDDSYRYFFRLWQIPAVYKTEVSKQLFVVCEDEDICQPQGNPKWEIALFDATYEGKITEAGFWQPDELLKVYRFIPQ